MNEIRAITVFVRAAALGSLRKAAVDQGISPQAASLSIMQLEKQLGARLFHRTTRRLSLTAEGERFLEAARPGLEALMAAYAGAQHATEAIAGPMRIAAPRSMLGMIWPALAEFAAGHPEVSYDLRLDDRWSDWVSERIDVGLRAGVPPDGRLIARRLMPVQLIVCASPAYLEKHGAPASIDDLARHRCTGYLQANTGRIAPWEFLLGGETVYRDVPAVLCANDPEAEALAVRDGLGVGQLGSFHALPMIRSGQVVPLLLDHISSHLGVYLCYARRTQLPLRLRAFIDFMVARMGNNPEWILSRDEIAAWRKAGAGKASAAKAPAGGAAPGPARKAAASGRKTPGRAKRAGA